MGDFEFVHDQLGITPNDLVAVSGDKYLRVTYFCISSVDISSKLACKIWRYFFVILSRLKKVSSGDGNTSLLFPAISGSRTLTLFSTFNFKKSFVSLSA